MQQKRHFYAIEAEQIVGIFAIEAEHGCKKSGTFIQAMQ